MAEAEDWTWTCPMMPETVQKTNMKRMLSELNVSISSDESGCDGDTEEAMFQEPADILLTCKAVRSEVNFSSSSTKATVHRLV